MVGSIVTSLLIILSHGIVNIHESCTNALHQMVHWRARVIGCNLARLLLFLGRLVQLRAYEAPAGA